jgi:hypothetical protein
MPNEAPPAMTSLINSLTIAIPVYNDVDFIRTAVNSCLAQVGQIVIYDNCSTDGTSEICAELAAQYTHVKHIRHEKNLGAFENFKRPLFDCRTEYFQWVGSHDFLAENFTLPLLSALDKEPTAGLATGKSIFIDEKNAPTKKTKGTFYQQNIMLGDDPFARMASRTLQFNNCFAIYHIMRTRTAQASWLDTPCIGFDDAFLFNMAAAGKIIHNPACIFYARDLAASRKETTATDRHKKILVAHDAQELQTDLTVMTQSMIKTVTAAIQTPSDLPKAFQVFDAIYQVYHEPKKDRRRKRFKKRLRIGLISLIVLGGIFSLVKILYG